MLQEVQKAQPVAAAADEVRLQLPGSLRGDLGIAAAERHQRPGRPLPGLPDRLPGFLIAGGRHGAAVDLATGLNKLYIHYGDRSTYSMTTHVFVELMKLTLWLLTLLALPAMAIVILIYSGPMQFKIYDDDKARVTFIKQQLITELKNPKLSDAHRKEVNDDLLTIEAAESELNSRRTLYQVLWQNLTSNGRNQAKQEEYEKKLEVLMYTDIYTRASQLKQIQTTE